MPSDVAASRPPPATSRTFWKGFGAFANYTRLEAEGNYGTGGAISLAPTTEVAGFNPKNANVGLSYIRNKLSVRLQMNHRGRYLSTFNANQSRLQYTVARTTLDLKTVFQISRHFDFHFDALNVLNERDMAVDAAGRTMRDLGDNFFDVCADAVR